MSTQEKTVEQLTAKLSEVSELLKTLTVELELRGYEKHDEVIKRSLLMQKEINELARE